MTFMKGILIFGILFTGDFVSSLYCWHCISEDCDTDPARNLKATKKLCNKGQVCQKVYFEMIGETDSEAVSRSSTVRGCSSNCRSKDDFMENCTQNHLESRGCVRKDCCRDQDLCNSAYDHFSISRLHYLFCVISFQMLMINFSIFDR